jgi:UDP-N-acetylglucosamine 2-epimerase (non-hydrolysing)/GDP/UDP-N,N'-diacetylbacillosamine 2-epimerase (hydrolysing)
MKPMLRVIEEDPELELLLMVTDQHLNPQFGATIGEVEADFRVAAGIDMEQVDGSPSARVTALGTCLSKMAKALQDLVPDIIVLYGDRGEVLVTAIAALNMGIPIAHLQGGDRSGNVDELMRHSLTKLAHLHFPASEEGAARIRGLGEEEWRIDVVGDNHVDSIVAGEYTDAKTLAQRFDLRNGEKPIVVLQHPETTRVRDNHADMQSTLDAILERGRRTIVVYPCSDQGYEDIVRAIESRRGHPGLSVHKNIDAPDFWGLLSNAAAMAGNSSAGLIETPYFPIPAINLGERQIGRLHAENVIHAEFGKESVAAALDTALEDEAFASTVARCSRPFGDGSAYRRIVDRLKQVELGERLLTKSMTY